MAKLADKPIAMKIVADHVEEVSEVADLVDRLEAEADRDIAAGSVTLRWGREQIALVKRAAALIGVPYQTYLKLVVYKQAIADIERTQAVITRQALADSAGALAGVDRRRLIADLRAQREQDSSGRPAQKGLGRGRPRSE
ncbi:MAG TPA: hypothetical protein VKT80_05215 [Chloroflexota bacterium]|nr:hypothetical protein [Chloroflexota bacterium]